MPFIIKPYVLSACKVQGTVLGAVRHREAWEGFRKKELSFPKTTLTLFQLPLLESFFFPALSSILLYNELLTGRDQSLIPYG